MDLKLPHLGEGADSGTVVNLFVKEGDQIAKDQAVLELENEKAVATIPSTAEGIVTKLFVKAGDKISVGQRILSIDEKGGGEAKPAKAETAARTEKVEDEQNEHEKSQEEPADHEDGQPKAKPGIAPAASPFIRKMAQDLGIDLTR